MERKNIVFHNPHVEIWYKIPLFHFLTKRKSFKKYEYLFDLNIKEQDKVHVLVDGFGSSFPIGLFYNRLFAIIEFYGWCLVNRIPFNKIRLHTSAARLKENDVVFAFIYGNFTHYSNKFQFDINKLANSFAASPAKIVLHATHYFYFVDKVSKFVEIVQPDAIVAESNLSRDSDFFKKYFSFFCKEVINIPFVPKPRFQRQLTKKSINKAIATGTIPFPIEDKCFTDFFKSGNLHPMRVEIYNNHAELKDYIDSFISVMKEQRPHSFWDEVPIIRSIRNFFLDKQTKYFSFNIVEKYNEYKMFIVPEEIAGLPCIGFTEGMLCGCAYIGKMGAMYDELGMIAGKNYIGYDGTLEDLISKIKYYQSAPDVLNEIATNGYEFAKNIFKPEFAYNKLMNKLNNI